MYNRTMKIVKHQLKDRLDLVFRITRIMGKSCVLNLSQSMFLSQEIDDLPMNLVGG